MKEIELAKQYYHHQEYNKAIDTILAFLAKNTISNKSIDYPDILCYLGNSRLGLYNKTKNKSLIYEALTDFATGANALLIFHQRTSDNLNKQLKKCIELI